MRKMLLVAVLCLSSCANGQGISMIPYEDKNSSPKDFILCHGFGCSHKTRVQLTDGEWKRVLAPLKKKAKNAEAERSALAKSVGLMESTVTKVIGATPDQGEAHTFEKDQDQMDCIDEAINTTHYLEFIQAADVLKFHRVHDPVHRGYFINGVYPHNSGAVEELSTGHVYVIDSYYFASGHTASVVPLDVWLNNWRPEEIVKARAAAKSTP
jgi:hypothetical protein